ncbi:MAG: hypothetical protein QQN41_04520 [Nitrosopumilus sp.]
MIFSTEIDNIFPTTSATIFDSLMDDVTNFGSKASDSVDQRIDESIDKIMDTTSNSITNEISEAGEKISNEISEVKKSSQKTIGEKISNFNPIENIKNIFTGSSGSPSTTSSSTTSSSTTSSSTTSPITYETLSLSTKQQPNDNILLQYFDSSGKTKSVTVVIRTEQKEIFSGTFFTSMFETTVNDASGIPYYVDMVVEHEDYGTVTSSVFNTGGTSDSKINGIFYQ